MATTQSQTFQPFGSDIGYGYATSPDGTTMPNTTGVAGRGVGDMGANAISITNPTQASVSAQAPAVRYEAPVAAAFDDSAIRARHAADLQAQVDAIKGSYVGTINAEQVAGEGRVGQQRGLSTISGTRYSPRGAAEQQGVERANQGAIDAIYAKMRYEIAQANAASAGLTMQDVSAQRQDAMTAAQNAATNYFAQMGLSQQDAQNAADNAYRVGIATGTIGGQQTMDMRNYLSGEAQNAVTNRYNDATAARADKQLEIDVQNAQKKNYQIQTLPDGTVVSFDPQTGTQEVLGKFAAPRSTGGGGSPASKATMDGSSDFYDGVIEDIRDGIYDPSTLSAADWANINAREAYKRAQNAGGPRTAAGFDTGAMQGPPVPAGGSSTPSRYGGSLNIPVISQISDYGNRALDWLYGRGR